MSTVVEIERKLPTRRAASRQRALAPVAEEPQREQPFPYASGRHIVQDHYGLGWPEWATGDIIEVDFDVTSYRGEGIYIFDRFNPTAPKWCQRWLAARRFGAGIGAGLHMRGETRDGVPAWVAVTDEELAMTKFIGRVERVYRDATKWRPGIRTDGMISAMTATEDGTTQLVLRNGEDSTLTIGGISTALANHSLGQLLGQRVRLILETEELTR